MFTKNIEFHRNGTCTFATASSFAKDIDFYDGIVAARCRQQHHEEQLLGAMEDNGDGQHTITRSSTY